MDTFDRLMFESLRESERLEAVAREEEKNFARRMRRLRIVIFLLAPMLGAISGIVGAVLFKLLGLL